MHDDNGGVGTSVVYGHGRQSRILCSPCLTAISRFRRGDGIVHRLGDLHRRRVSTIHSTTADFTPSRRRCNPKAESFTYDINWGDGRDAINGQTIADTDGGPGTQSSGTIAASHTYADDGEYQVTVTVHDDNGGVGISQFIVTVSNKNPVVTTPHGDQSIFEGDTVNFTNLATFTDAGSDNPVNNNPFTPPAVGNPKAESLTYDIDWGDGRDAINGQTIADTDSGPGTSPAGRSPPVIRMPMTARTRYRHRP